MVKFKKSGWLYWPVNIAGWVLVILGIIFLVSVYTTYHKHSHGAGDLIYKIYPHYIGTFLLYLWIGDKTSK